LKICGQPQLMWPLLYCNYDVIAETSIFLVLNIIYFN